MDKYLYDKNGIPIKKHDLLKVYHFTGQRRKKHFMYKYVLGVKTFGNVDTPFFEISSLSESGHTYYERLDNRKLEDYEILQGTMLEERQKTQRIKDD